MAKRFIFRLEPVLRWRKREEEQAVQRMAYAKGEWLMQEKRRFFAEEQAGRFLRERESVLRRENLLLEEILLWDQWEDHWNKNVREAQHAENEAHRRFEQERRRAVEASRRRRLLENLKERKIQEHQQTLAKEEQKFLDEFAGLADYRRGEIQNHRPDSFAESGGRKGR